MNVTGFTALTGVETKPCGVRLKGHVQLNVYLGMQFWEVKDDAGWRTVKQPPSAMLYEGGISAAPEDVIGLFGDEVTFVWNQKPVGSVPPIPSPEPVLMSLDHTRTPRTPSPRWRCMQDLT